MVDILVKECDETIDEEVEIIDDENKCNFCIVNIVLFSIFFIINVGIGAYYWVVNTGIVKKKMFLDMIMFIKQKFI